jgi:hypothetical protein
LVYKVRQLAASSLELQMILVLVCGRNHAGFWEGMCCLWRNWALRMAV